MEIFLFALITIIILANFFLLVSLLNSKKNLAEISASNSTLLERSENFGQTINNQNSKIKSLESDNNELLIFKGRFNEAQKIIEDLKIESNKAKQEIEKLNQNISNFEKNNSLLIQEKQNLEAEKLEWSNKKQAILTELSEELIKKNNIQQDSFSKKQQEEIEKTITVLNEKFANILNKVSSLNDDVQKTSNDIDLTKNALLNPGQAGRMSEVTLENILKASGLKEKNNIQDAGDFIMQSHFFDQQNSGKRPDAMVFLPKDNILIIDSKSSSHFLELQQALDKNDDKNKKEIEAKIKESMRRHLEELKKRDYASAKSSELDLKDFSNVKNVPIITTIMFIQTEKMLETLRFVDPIFEIKALEARIQVLSPAGLINLLYQAKSLIENVRQEKNVEILKVEIRKLMEAIGTMISRAGKMGDAITKSLKTYNEFVGTFNGRFLPRIVNMNKLGISAQENVNIEKLKKISLDGDLIEAEVLNLEDESSN